MNFTALYRLYRNCIVSSPFVHIICAKWLPYFQMQQDNETTCSWQPIGIQHSISFSITSIHDYGYCNPVTRHNWTKCCTVITWGRHTDRVWHSNSVNCQHTRTFYLHQLTTMSVRWRKLYGLCFCRRTIAFLCKELGAIRNGWLKGKGKGRPYSIAERRVPELIPVLGSQPVGDVSHKPNSRLPLLSARPAVTLAIIKRAATNFTAWWTEAQWVWTVCLRLLLDSVAAAIWTRALLRLSPAR